MIAVYSLAPPLDPSLNWPRDLRAGMFAIAEEIERIGSDIRDAAETILILEGRLTWVEQQRTGQCLRLERLITRWTIQRAKLRRFFDNAVFADIKVTP